MTASVEALDETLKAHALLAVSSYTAFSEANDPHGERDFGTFELLSRRFFWKIDYYDERCEMGSSNPADTTITTRVLTLMLAEDY